MSIIKCLNEGIYNYLYVCATELHSGIEFFKGARKEQLLTALKTRPIRDESNYGFFSYGDKGLKRAKFLLLKLEEWQAKGLEDYQIIQEFSLLYANNNEPPFGLGNSKKMRSYLALALASTLNIKQGAVTDEEIKAKHDYLYIDTEEGPYIIPRERIIAAILTEKADKELRSNALDPDRNKLTHYTLEMLLTKTSHHYDRNVMKEIFKYNINNAGQLKSSGIS